MAEPTVIASDLIIRGTVSAGTFNLASGCVTDTMVANAANIAASKVVHHFPVSYGQVGGTDVTDATSPLHIAKAAGTISAVKILPLVAPTGGDKKFTVDLKKSTSAGAYATVLSAVVTVDNTSVDRTVQSGTLNTTTYSAGDTFQVVVTVSGSTGSQGQGMLTTVFFQEPTA